VGCRGAFRAAVHLGGLVHEMVKGANAGLAALSEDVGSVMVGLGWSSATGEGDADVSVQGRLIRRLSEAPAARRSRSEEPTS